MPSERQNMSEQDISIKAREHELYVPVLPDANAARQTVPCLLARDARRTPFAHAPKSYFRSPVSSWPCSFVAAVWRVTHPRAAKPKTGAARPAAKTAFLVDPRAPAGDFAGGPFHRAIERVRCRRHHCGLATLYRFRYPMVSDRRHRMTPIKGCTDDDLLPDRSVGTGPQSESCDTAIIGGPVPGRLIRVKMTTLAPSRKC